jgi:hypothetical protein
MILALHSPLRKPWSSKNHLFFKTPLYLNSFVKIKPLLAFHFPLLLQALLKNPTPKFVTPIPAAFKASIPAPKLIKTS